MKDLLKALNEAGIFHTIERKNGKIVATVLKQPAEMDQEGKDMLKKFYGLEDFTVPKKIADSVWDKRDNDAMLKAKIQKAKQTIRKPSDEK